MTLQQITLHRTEALKLLQHILEIRTAVNRAFDRYYRQDFDEIESQLLAIKQEVDQLMFYLETEHQIGINKSEDNNALRDLAKPWLSVP